MRAPVTKAVLGMAMIVFVMAVVADPVARTLASGGFAAGITVLLLGLVDWLAGKDS